MRLRPTGVVIGGLAIAIILIAVSACTSDAGEYQWATPISTMTSVRAGSSSPSGDGSRVAPRIAHPLDASRFIAAPCSALTAADLAGLHVINPVNSGADRIPAGVLCAWAGSPGGDISIGWETVITNGLSNLYSRRSTIAYWQPLTISGYPAAYGDAVGDSRSRGNCVINVGVSDQLYFNAEFSDPANAGSSCVLAAQVATDVIRNLEKS